MLDTPLTVLHVDSSREYRGGQNQVRLLIAGLARRGGIRQTLVAREGSRLVDEARALGVEVRPVPWRAAVDGTALAALRSAFGSNWDVVHGHDGHAVQSVLLARALAGGKSRVVASRRVSVRAARPFVWQRADLVIAVSAGIRDVLVRQGVDRRRVEVVYSGVDPVELGPPEDAAAVSELRAAAGVRDGELLVAAVGALEEAKDHRTFVLAAAEIASRHPQVRFAVFGEGPRRPELERLVGERLEGRFALPGEFPRAARALEGIDVFVMPSKQEGLGTACVEAMLAGRPVVSTDAGGLAELGRSGAFRPVPPGDPNALATALEVLLKDPDARRAAGEAARNGGARFTAESMVEGTLRCYLALARSVG